VANWANRILAVVNTFTGRPSPTNVEAAYQVRAPAVNANFQGSALAVAFCQALGTECTDNTSTAVLCKLKLPLGRFVAGDRVTVIEDRPTGRIWCVVPTAAIPRIEFGDADLQDSALAGTADYDTIRADLLLVETAPLDSFVWPRQAILVGGAHGLSGTVIPWQDGNTQTIEAKLLAAIGPAGSDTQVQFNDAGNLGGDAGLRFDKSTGAVSIGDSNTILGSDELAVGTANLQGGDRSVVVGNDNEIDAGSDDTLVVGDGNLIMTNSPRSVILGEDNVVAASTNRAFVTGLEGKATIDNSRVHAGGQVVTAGDNQFGRVPAGIGTSDAALHILYSLPIVASTTYTVRGMVTARTAAGVSAGWTFVGVVCNTGGTSRDIAAIAPAKIGDVLAAAWTCAVAANNGTDTLDISVQNPGGATIIWGLTLEWEEVTL